MNFEASNVVLIILTAISTLVAFVTSSRSTRRRFGAIYEKTIQQTLRDLALCLGSIIIYSAISAVSHGWAKIFYSPEPAITAFLLMVMVCHSLAQGASLRSSNPVDASKLARVSALSLGTLCVSLLLTVTSFQSEKISLLIASLQVFVLVSAAGLFYSVISCMALLKADYVPPKR